LLYCRKARNIFSTGSANTEYLSPGAGLSFLAASNPLIFRDALFSLNGRCCIFVRMKKMILLAVFTLLHIHVHAQEKPRLVVGIVVDQMRQDYLTRFMERYSANGFKRILGKGFSYENCQYSYIPTYTAPGHASIYTGTVPAVHGIVANDWYRRGEGKVIYCTDDSSKEPVGARKGKGSSPVNMYTTTITDQLRLSNNFSSKVIAVALKDRSSILPAGHSANAAYWYDAKAGRMISSTHYMEELPVWMQDFNARLLPDKYLENTWEMLYSPDTYTASAKDNNPYEGKLDKDKDPVFPYDLSFLQQRWGYVLLNYTPWGNTYTLDAAKAAIEGEKLGTRNVTDFLCISFSATDYAGHFFGPQAVEIEDMYLRLDLDLAAFFSYLDEKVGKGMWSLFLTADHGGNDVPGLLKEHKIPSGLLDTDALVELAESSLYEKYGDSLILRYINGQFYLNREKIRKNGINGCEAEQYLADAFRNFPGITKAYAACNLNKSGFSAPLEQRLHRGHHPKESGDVLLLGAPGWMDFGPLGTTHGSPYSYDTRVPLIFYGAGFLQGKSSRPVCITDISPTLAIMLGIHFPNGTTGLPLPEVLGY
jgi:predicted AlkP superfamily pyrophosphatase or phosphodiesterase